RRFYDAVPEVRLNCTGHAERFVDAAPSASIGESKEFVGLAFPARMSSQHEFPCRPAEPRKEVVVSLQDAAFCKIPFRVRPPVLAEPLAKCRIGTQRADRINHGS